MKKKFLFTTALAAILSVSNAHAAYQDNPMNLGSDVILSNHKNENGNGGAIFNNNTSNEHNYTGTTFENNSALNGGAVYDENANIELNGTKFENNSATVAGGAVYHGGSNPLKIYQNSENSTFTNNTAGIKGGAIAIENAMNNMIYNGVFEGNKVTGTDNSGMTGGGAIYVGNYGNMYVSGTEQNHIIFKNNEAADFGGAIATDRKHTYGEISIKNSDFTGNKAGVSGGAVANSMQFSKIYSSNFINNSAGENGGAIWNGKDAAITFLGGSTIFSGNTANGELNDIHNEGSLYVGNTIDKVDVVLDGGISGDGDIYIQYNGQLTTGANTKITNNINNNGTLYVKGNFELEKDLEGYGDFKISDNGTVGILNDVTIDNSIENNGSINISGNLDLNSNVYGEGQINVSENSSINMSEGGLMSNAVVNNGSFNVGGMFGLTNNVLGSGQLNISTDSRMITMGDTRIDNTIANGGIINVNGNMCLNGNITNNQTNGTIIFAEGTSLTVNADKQTQITHNEIKNEGANLHIVFANGYKGEYILVGEGASLDNEFDIIQDNNLYNIEKTDVNGKYMISKKDDHKISENLGANNNQSNAIGAVTAGGNSNNSIFDKVSSEIGNKLQSENKSEVAEALNGVTALSPETAPLVRSTQTDISNQIYNVVGTRLTGGAVSAGVSSGDTLDRGSMWAQTLINKSELGDTAEAKGYEADSNGVAFGFEKNVTEDIKLGVGYAFTKTDVDGFMRDKDIETHTAIVYAEYKPNNWYVNTIATYGWSDYEENKDVLGHQVEADYDVENIGLQVMSGYDIHIDDYSITPEVGLRYAHISQDDYTDTTDQHVSGNESDILTGVVGVKASKSWELTEGIRIEPEVKLAATYDMMNDNSNSVVTLANGSSYWVKGEELDRAGIEVGVGVTAEFTDKVEVSLSYEGKFRDNYRDNTGMLNLKYNF